MKITPDEARALVDARRAETPLDYIMRVSVYPSIRESAEGGGCSAWITHLPVSDPRTANEWPAHREVAERLRAEGWKAQEGLDRYAGPYVEVSW